MAELPVPLIPFLLGLVAGAVLLWWWRVRPLRAELVKVRDEREELLVESTSLRTELQNHRRAHEERLRELETKFKALADDILQHNSAKFLELVSERFRLHHQQADQALEARKREIEQLVRPLAENLERFKNTVDGIEKAREGAYRAVLEQVRMLADSHQKLERHTRSLIEALRRPQVRGRWGEYQLRNVVELAGMSEHVDFTSQPAVEGSEGRLRPDAIVRLPGGKTVVVDVKTPLDAYLAAIEAADEEQRRAAFARHAQQLRQHVRQLASKAYWTQFSEAPDFVVMFIPGEAFYAAAVEQDPALFEDALKQKVLITTPSTFVALMKAIAYGWQQEKLAESAQQVANLGQDLYERIARFLDHMQELGRALGRAVRKYNEAAGSLEGRVLPQARRFEQLGIAASAPLAPLSQLESQPRVLQAPELPAPPGEEEARPRASGEPA